MNGFKSENSSYVDSDEYQGFGSSGTVEGRPSHFFYHALCVTIKKYTNSMRFRLFKENFPHIYKRYPVDLEAFHAKFLTHLHTTLKRNVLEAYTEHGVSDVLDYLDLTTASSLDKETEKEELCSAKDSTRKDKLEYRNRLALHLRQLICENEEEEEAVLWTDMEIILAAEQRIKDLNLQISNKLDYAYDSASKKED